MDKLACRACLATDRALYALHDNNLHTAFQDLVGFEIPLSNMIPGYLCYICRHKVLGYKFFKEKCIKTQILLMKNLKTIGLSTVTLAAQHSFCQNLTLSKTKVDLTSYSDNNEFLFIDFEIEGVEPKQLDNNKQTNEETKDKIETDQNLSSDNDDSDVKSEPQDIEHCNVDDVNYNYDDDCKSDLEKIAKNDKNNFGKNENTIDKQQKSTEIKVEDREGLKKEKDTDLKIAFNEQEGKCTITKRQSTRNSIRDDKVKESKTKIPKQRKKPTQRNEKADKETIYERKQKNTMKKYNLQMKLLSKKEQIERFEARKESPVYKNSRYKCNLCFKGMATESVYTAHQALHQPNARRQFECPVCHLYVVKTKRLIHLKEHEAEITCLTCGDKTITFTKLRTHFEGHQNNEYQCKECHKVFRSRTALSDHIRKKFANITCSICGHKVIKGMALHMTRRHPQAVSCEKCNLMFNDKNALENHIQDCIGTSESSYCPFCGESFENMAIMEEHIRSHKKDFKYKREEVKVVRKRNRVLLTKDSELSLDTKDNRKFLPEAMCDVCGKLCATKYTLADHKRIHTGEKPFQCPHCSRTFRLQPAYKKHLRIHTGERPYKCEQCGKSFIQQSHLRSHTRLVHTSERPFRCAQCPKSFAFRTCVRVHQRAVHRGERVRRRRPPHAGGGDLLPHLTLIQ